MHPLAFASRAHDSGTPQISQVPADFWLISLKNLHKKAHTYFISAHQIQQTQPGPVGEGTEKQFLIKRFWLPRHNGQYLTTNKILHIRLDIYPKVAKESDMSDRKRVLILCTGNSARSQMAEGLLRDLAGDRFEVASAGVSPAQVRPEAITVMRESGIDISQHRAKSVDEFTDQQFDYVITVCDNANEQCPVFPGNTERIHWSFDDPAAAQGDEPARLAVFRRVRDEILQQLQAFIPRAGASPSS